MGNLQLGILIIIFFAFSFPIFSEGGIGYVFERDFILRKNDLIRPIQVARNIVDEGLLSKVKSGKLKQ